MLICATHRNTRLARGFTVGLGTATAVFGAADVNAQPAPPAPALGCALEAQAPCQITLRSGAIFVGQVVDIVPGERLTLRIATGEERILSWPAIVSAVQTAPLPPMNPDATAPRSSIPVRIQGLTPDMHVELRPRGHEDEAPWGTLCREPCPPFLLDGRYDYRLFANDGTGSPEISAPERAQALHIRVKPGSRSHRRAGIALIVAGAIVTSAVFPGYYILQTPNFTPSDATRHLSGQILAGVGTGLGIPLLGVGIFLQLYGATRLQITPTPTL